MLQPSGSIHILVFFAEVLTHVLFVGCILQTNREFRVLLETLEDVVNTWLSCAHIQLVEAKYQLSPFRQSTTFLVLHCPHWPVYWRCLNWLLRIWSNPSASCILSPHLPIQTLCTLHVLENRGQHKSRDFPRSHNKFLAETKAESSILSTTSVSTCSWGPLWWELSMPQGSCHSSACHDAIHKLSPSFHQFWIIGLNFEISESSPNEEGPQSWPKPSSSFTKKPRSHSHRWGPTSEPSLPPNFVLFLTKHTFKPQDPPGLSFDLTSSSCCFPGLRPKHFHISRDLRCFSYLVLKFTSVP